MAGKKAAGGKSMLAKAKSAAKGKFNAAKAAASKAVTKARGAGKNKGKK